jgi:hypothetical protein
MDPSIWILYVCNVWNASVDELSFVLQHFSLIRMLSLQNLGYSCEEVIMSSCFGIGGLLQ